MPQPVQVCQRCVLKSTIPYLTFDEQGLCSACTKPWRNFTDEDRHGAEQKMVEMFDLAKQRKPPYHVLSLVSGGADSCYLLDLLKRRYGLRPLALHIAEDIGRELAESNARRIAQATGTELMRFSMDTALVKRWLREGLPLCFQHQLGPHAGRDLMVHLRRAVSINLAARLGIPIVAEGVEIGQYPHRLLLRGERKLRHWRESKKRKALLAIFKQVFGDEHDGSLYDFDLSQRTAEEVPDHVFPNAILPYDKSIALPRLAELGLRPRDLGSGHTNTEINPFVSLFSYQAYDAHVNEEHIATEVRRAGYWTISMGKRHLGRQATLELLEEIKQATLFFAYSSEELPDTLGAYGRRFARMRESVGHDPAFVALLRAMRKVRFFAQYFDLPLPPAEELGYQPRGLG